MMFIKYNYLQSSIMIRLKISFMVLHCWILMRLKKYRACIKVLRQCIRWAEGLDSARYYPFIAKANIRMAQCYMAIKLPSSAIEHCYLAADNYSTEKDIRIRNKAISIRAQAFTAMAMEHPTEKEKWLQYASEDLAILSSSK